MLIWLVLVYFLYFCVLSFCFLIADYYKSRGSFLLTTHSILSCFFAITFATFKGDVYFVSAHFLFMLTFTHYIIFALYSCSCEISNVVLIRFVVRYLVNVFGGDFLVEGFLFVPYLFLVSRGVPLYS